MVPWDPVEPWLLLAVFGAAAVGFLGFVLGDRRRRNAHGLAGPRPAPSIGEAVAQAKKRETRALVFFLGEDARSLEVGSRLAQDSGVLALLERDAIPYAVLRTASEGEDVIELLFRKYAGDAEASWPAVALLDGDGERAKLAHLSETKFGAEWLANWLGTFPVPGA